MLANWITLSRFPLLLITVLILYFGSPWVRLAGVVLLFLGLMLDTVDGVVARTSWMRTRFAVTTVVTFCGLALAQAFSGFPASSAVARIVPSMMTGLRVTAWLAVLFCIFRGLPVIISSLRRYWGIPSAAPA